jgi:hypothetical protein
MSADTFDHLDLGDSDTCGSQHGFEKAGLTAMCCPRWPPSLNDLNVSVIETSTSGITHVLAWWMFASVWAATNAGISNKRGGTEMND